ncbi:MULTISPECIES: holo-ACP synthase [Isoptericola]|uniref:Holo-[acyl-carrier-protein] synthase n=1 Tax=Isoptericola sediminis TaxID=2733572 RepID=A0A849K138_9MICO|nr:MULTISPECIES: holo-ACP synthase [unclassified Isoptericola]MDO8143144.1 holo-ACP synthase [Isoptericola sp. 178]MDO8147005.1 holo-ACP synthase [Isoptericola sp. b515]MDO8150680.1 holo-ACP synthase [Isoptericola sp. b408]NNU26868.1 holo-ACP synthase [Isoptericola sediminis]
MIIGVGIDVVDVERFMATLERTPRLREKLFTEAERDLPASSLAARFAAKEAIAKALGAPGTMHWHDATVHRVVGGPPQVELRGSVQARADELGIRRWHLSISHDAGISSAMVVAED